MNIVISAAGKDWRGTENVTWMLVQGFRRRGHNVLVLCRPDSALQQRLIAENIEHAAVLGGLDLGPLSLWRCVRVLKRFRADVVLTQKDKDIRLSGVAARLVGVPVLVSHVTFFGMLAFTQMGNLFYDAASTVQSRASVFARWKWFHLRERRKQEAVYTIGPAERLIGQLRWLESVHP